MQGEVQTLNLLQDAFGAEICNGLVVSVPTSSAKSARGPEHESRSDQILTSLGITV
jgi:hypothetical protein